MPLFLPNSEKQRKVPILLPGTVVEGTCKKVGGLKYSAPNINVYILMIFTAFARKVKSGGALPPMRYILQLHTTFDFPLSHRPQMVVLER